MWQQRKWHEVYIKLYIHRDYNAKLMCCIDCDWKEIYQNYTSGSKRKFLTKIFVSKIFDQKTLFILNECKIGLYFSIIFHWLVFYDKVNSLKS